MKSLPLSMNPSDPPPFYELDDSAFQEMCRDIFERQEGVGACEIYGVSGQAQYGTDLKAVTQSGSSVEVAQCKCYKEFPVREIIAASNSFLNHLEFWRGKNVTRFVLFVACPLDTTQQQDEVDKQRSHFADLGIRYEAWSSRTLRTKLKDYRDIVYRYTRSFEWVDAICGPPIDSEQLKIAGAAGLVESVISSQLIVYSAGLSKEIATRLERIRDLYREGKRNEAYKELLEIEEGSTWPILEIPLKGRILRLRAAYRLDLYSDVNGAKQLADEAFALDPSGDESLIRAFLLYYTDGPQAALELVSSPTNSGTLNAKLAFLLDLDRAADLIKTIDETDKNLRDIETNRLQALALLVSCNIDLATTTIRAALSAQPTWEFLRFSAAIIDYFSCFAPSALPSRLIPWPEPPNLAIVKSDEKTRERLRRAEQAFSTLYDKTKRGDEWRHILETWRLACLANDTSRQSEARDFCVSLLKREPAHYRALIWALMRNFEVDFRNHEKQLLALGKSDVNIATRLESISTVVNFYLLTDKAPAAKAVLNDYRAEFESVGAERNLKLWDSQILISEGGIQGAIENARKERDSKLRRHLLLITLRSQAEATKDWRAYLNYLERNYRRSKRADYLFELCSVHAELDDWQYVADRAKELIENIQTPAAVRLAATALWRLQKKDNCLKILNASERYFPGKTLPGDLSRMKVDCQIKTGALPEAVYEAKELRRRDESTQNLITLMQAQLSYGDLKELAVTARDLIKHQDVQPDTLVRAATLIHREDPDLAARLWRQAASTEVDDPTLLAGLIEAGFLLGLDPEVAPLFKQAQDFSAQGKGPFQLVSLDDVITAQRERQQRTNELQRDYERGLLPLHLLTKSFERTLTDILHGIPNETQGDFKPLVRPRIFIRHGGRRTNHQFAESSSAWRLCLDVSALLIAEHLGILEAVERLFKPLLVSPKLITALVAQLQKLQFNQPSQICTSAAILELLKQGSLRCSGTGSNGQPDNGGALDELAGAMGSIWISSLRQANDQGGFLVDHFPLRTHTPPILPINIPEPYDKLVIGCRTIVQTLRENGWISQQMHEAAISGLEKRGDTDVNNPSLPEHTKLFLHGNVVESLQQAGVLDVTCKHYEVFVDDFYVKHAQSITQSGRYLDNLTAWLRGLIDRVRGGLANGTYQCLPVSEDTPDEAGENGEPLDAATIKELLSHRVPKGSVLWIDDRHINSYLRSDAAPIIGVNETLTALRKRGELTEGEYYDKLIKLRAGNYRYIPINKREILWHLQAAPIREGKLQETPELKTLRRYIAGALLDVDCLQIVPVPPGATSLPGEAAFILGTKRALDEALVSVWKDDTSVAEIRANWLLNNMYTGSFGIRHLLPNSQNRDDATFLLGLDMAGMLTAGILSLGNPLKEDSKNRRARFIDWYENRVMLPRLNVNAEAATVAASTISSFITHGASEPRTDDTEEKVSRLINQVLFSEIPNQIRNEIKLSPEVTEWIDTKLIETVNIGNRDFEQNSFAVAVEKTINGQVEAPLTGINESDRYKLRRVADEDGIPVIELVDTSTAGQEKPVFRIKDEFLLTASSNYDDRRRTIEGNRFWFDCNGVTFDSKVLPIASLEDARERMEQVQVWRKRSTEVYYRELHAKLTRSPDFLWSELMPPSADGMLSHFRLPPGPTNEIDFPSVWNIASKSLLIDEGLEVALNRLALVPIRIPNVAVQKLIDLPLEERASLIERFTSQWTSPVAKLHLADISIRAFPDETSFSFAQKAVSALYEDTAAMQYALFEALLRFVNEELANWKEAAEWSDATRLTLICAHANRLHHLFNSLNAHPEKLAKTITSFISSQSAAEVLHRDQPIWGDALYWRRLSREAFLTYGVSAVLSVHSKEITNQLELKTRIDQAVFKEDERKPLIPLMRDPELMTNLTGSFLGGDHSTALSSIMEQETSGLSSTGLKSLVSTAIDKLQTDPNSIDWGTIDLVVGDLPIYADLSSRLQGLTNDIDFAAIYERDVFSALLAIRVASNEMVYWNDKELRSRLENSLLSLLKLAERGRDNKQTVSFDAQVGALLEAALRLSIEPNNPQESSRRFSSLLRRMLDQMPTLVEFFGAGFVSLLLQLPAAQLHGMWPFLLAVRATAEEAL